MLHDVSCATGNSLSNILNLNSLLLKHAQYCKHLATVFNLNYGIILTEWFVWTITVNDCYEYDLIIHFKYLILHYSCPYYCLSVIGKFLFSNIYFYIRLPRMVTIYICFYMGHFDIITLLTHTCDIHLGLLWKLSVRTDYFKSSEMTHWQVD